MDKTHPYPVNTHPIRTPRRERLLVPAIPAAVAVILSLPVVGLAYLLDDYDFFARVQTFRPSFLLPDSSIVFYRPLSREVYFGLINFLSPTDPLLGHILNVLLLAATIFLFTVMMIEFAGYRSGLVSGLALSCLAQWPVLVAWISGGQDLLPVALSVIAMMCMWRGQLAASLVVFLLALLAKESAIAAIPALILIQWLRQRSVASVVRTAMFLGMIVVLWATQHPGVRLLLERGSASPPGSYIGLGDPAGALMEGIAALLNIPLATPSNLRAEVVLAAVAALACTALTLWLSWGAGSRGLPRDAGKLSSKECLVLGLSLAIPALLVTCLLVRNWAGYYACYPAVGIAAAAAPWLGSRKGYAIAATVGYLALGVVARGVALSPEKLTEISLASSGKALRRVEQNFKRLRVELPPGSMAYVTTMATGSINIYHHLHTSQALRIWYGQPTIQTLRPELRVATGGEEFLFLIEPDLDVCEIDLSSLSFRSTGDKADEWRIRGALRSYAIGLANSGGTHRALEILLLNGSGVDARIAGMLLLSQGRAEEAGRILTDVPDMKLKTAFEAVAMLLTVPTRGVHYEKHAMTAFGLPYESPEIIENLTSVLFELGYMEVAGRLARHLLSLQPGSRYAAYVLSEVETGKGVRDTITPPISRLEFPDLN